MPPPPCNFDPAGSGVGTSHSKSKSRHRRRRFPLNDEEGVASPSTTTSSASRRAERKIGGGGGGVVAAASKPTSQLSEAALADLYYSHISGSGPSEVYQNEVAAAPGPSRHLRRQKSGGGSKSGRRRNQKPGDANARRRLKKSVSASDAHVLPSHRGQISSSSSTRMQRTTAAAMSESISSFPDQSFAEISLEEEELPSAPMPGNVTDTNANTGAKANTADIDEDLVQAMIDQHIPIHLRNQFPHDVMRAILQDASSHNKNGSWGGSGHQQTQRPSTFTNLTDGVNLRPKSQSSFMVDRLNNIDGIPDMVDLQSFADDISLESLSVFTEAANLASAGDIKSGNAAVTKRQPRLPPPSDGQVRHKAADELDEDDDIDDDIDQMPPKPLVNVDTQDDDEINDDCDVNHPGHQCNTNGDSRFDTIDGNASTMTPLPPVRTISTYDNTDVPMTPVTHVSHGAQSTGASTIAPSVIPNRHRTDDSGIYPPSLEQQQQQNSSYSQHNPSNKPFHMLKISTDTTNTLETVPISMASAASSTSQSQQQEDCLRQQVQPHVHTVVSFGNVSIRYYETVIVVNPACRCGPSVGIGWMYQDGGKVDLGPIPSDDDIDNIEKCNRKKQSQLILSKDQRHQRLLDWGYTNQDIASSIRQLRKYKNQRKQTVNNLTAAGMEEAMESAKRKILSILVANKSS